MALWPWKYSIERYILPIFAYDRNVYVVGDHLFTFAGRRLHHWNKFEFRGRMMATLFPLHQCNEAAGECRFLTRNRSRQAPTDRHLHDSGNDHRHDALNRKLNEKGRAFTLLFVQKLIHVMIKTPFKYEGRKHGSKKTRRGSFCVTQR